MPQTGIGYITNQKENSRIVKFTFGFSTSSSTPNALKSLTNMDDAGKSLLIFGNKMQIDSGKRIEIHLEKKCKLNSLNKIQGKTHCDMSSSNMEGNPGYLFGFSSFLEESTLGSIFGTSSASHSLVNVTFSFCD